MYYLFSFCGKPLLFTDHCPEIEISKRPFVNQQKLAHISTFLLCGRCVSPVKCFYKVTKQISVCGMTVPTTLQYVNEGP